MDAREERLAKNEIVFRDVNERIEDMAVAQAQLLRDERDLGFLCECSNVDCTLRLPMRLDTYERVRSDPTLFLVAPGHELPEIGSDTTKVGRTAPANRATNGSENARPPANRATKTLRGAIRPIGSRENADYSGVKPTRPARNWRETAETMRGARL